LSVIPKERRQAQENDRREKRPGRPPTSEHISQLILQMARENPSWGYDRIPGALANLGHQVSDQTVDNILKANGIEPAPERKRQTTWKTFLKSHWDMSAAVDSTTIEVWTIGGLVTPYLLFVMELVTRRVHFAGCTPNPDELRTPEAVPETRLLLWLPRRCAQVTPNAFSSLSHGAR
jgi:hypothetical protein